MRLSIGLGMTMLAGTIACLGGAQRLERLPESRAALAVPEPDPACRGTVRQALASNGLDRVVVGLSPGADGGVEVVRFLEPDLTPAAADDLRRAVGSCAWSVSPAPDAGARGWVLTFLDERAAR